MRLEDFPLELWFEIFKYRQSIQAVESFHNLNGRIESMLISSMAHSTVDLNLIDSTFYERLTTQVGPKLKSIRIAHSELSWQEIAGYLRENYYLDQFIELQSLVFNDLPSIRLVENSIEQCQNLENLIHLHIENVTSSSGLCGIHALVKRIWSLPVLKDLKITTTELEFPLDFDAGATSTSLLSVELRGFLLEHEECVKLLRKTPNIERLSVRCSNFDRNKIEGTFNNIIEFSLIYNGSFESLKRILRSVPNLENFTLEVTLGVAITGSVWEKFIIHHLVKLKKFRFHLQYNLENMSQSQLNSIVESFSSPFWREILQAEIRFDLMKDVIDYLHCYTIPSIINNLDRLKSQICTISNK